MIDSLGIILSVLYLRANLHDIKGGKCLVAQTQYDPIYEKVEEIHADKAYRGIDDPRMVIAPLSQLKNFVPIKHRWKVERTIAWLGGYRRLDKDYEKYNMYGEGWVYLANTMIIDRKLS